MRSGRTHCQLRDQWASQIEGGRRHHFRTGIQEGYAGDPIAARAGFDDETDAREVITVLNPALDATRAIRSQIELAQLCFGDLNLKWRKRDSCHFLPERRLKTYSGPGSVAIHATR